MAKKNKEHEINLLPQEEFEASTLGRVLKWLLSTFRYIVIGTEMVVMAAFLSRFYLDAKSSELTDAINQKQTIVTSYLNVERRYREVQAKLATFTQFTSGFKPSPLITDIAQNIPNDVILDSVTISGTKLDITASTSNGNSASLFVTNLSGSKSLTNVNLSSLDSKLSGGISFNITATIGGGK